MPRSAACALEVSFWEVFFLIPMGRGRLLRGLAPEEFEAAFERLHRLSRQGRFVVKLTEAQHYRRFLAGQSGETAAPAPRAPGINGGPRVSSQAVNAGKGFMFVDHLGEICPSGFLPIAADNALRDSLAEVYRNSIPFKELRDPRRLKGKCGACEYAAVCAGSRARAYAVTGDYLDADPGCLYRPRGDAEPRSARTF